MTAADKTDDILSRLRALPTAAISDALDRVGIAGALHGIGPPGRLRLCFAVDDTALDTALTRITAALNRLTR